MTSATVIPAVIAVATVSMRLAEPGPPMIWAPSTRPVPFSATMRIVIPAAGGRYPASVVVSTVVATASNPAAAAASTLSPVRPISSAHSLVTAVPSTGLDTAVPPPMLMPATRPCLLA